MTALRLGFAALFGLTLCAALGAPEAAPPAAIAGQVLLPDGQPAADVSVYAQYRDLTVGEVVWVTAPADAQGRFSFPGKDDVGSILWQVAATKPGYALAYVLMFGRPPGDLILDLGAAPVALTGTVVDPGGAPIAQAEVTVSGFFGSHVDLRESPFLKTTTDAQGTFRLDGLPPGMTPGLTAVATHCAQVWAKGDLSQPGPLKIVLPPEATIAGRVTHAGQPVAGLKLGAQSDDGWGEAVTGADGSFLFEHLTAGKYNVAVRDFPEGLTAAAVEGVVVRAGDHHLAADLTLTPGALVQGKVTAVGGAPLAGAGIGAYGPAHPESGGWMQSVNTAADGAYSIRLPAGSNKLYMYRAPEGYSRNSQPQNRRVELQEGEPKTGQDFVLTSLAKVHGTVLLPTGQPAPGVAIRLLSDMWGGDEAGDPDTTTNAQGAFELPSDDPFGRANAPRQVFAQDAERGLAALVTVTDPAPALTLRLTPGAYLAGRAVDLEGQPVPKVPLTAYSAEGPPLASARTNADGRVLLGPLPAGTAVRVSPAGRWRYLVASADWERLTVTPTAAAVQQLPALRLNPAGRSQSGWVGDAAGQPVAGALVFAMGLEEPAATDAEGHFDLTGLPARGTLTLIAVHPTEELYAVKEIDPDWGFTPGLALQPLGSATGQVVDAAGKPLAKTRVPVWPQMQGYDYDSPKLSARLQAAGRNSTPETNAEGRFRVERLLPGVKYVVGMPQPGAHLVGGKRDFVAVSGTTVDLSETK